MRSAYVIAVNTFRETIRNHALYTILGFAAVIIALSISFGEWSVFARVQVMQDFGLATMSLSGLLLAVFIGVGMLGREISSKTVYALAAKPISRTSILAGKFGGLLFTLTLNFAAMSLFFLLSLMAIGGGLEPSLMLAVLLVWVEMAVIVAAALFFSAFSSSMLAALFTLGFFIAGHFNDLVDIDALSGGFKPLAGVLHLLYFAIPNLEHFNIRSRIVYEMGVPPGYIGFAILYGALYTLLFLLLAAIVFEQKDL